MVRRAVEIAIVIVDMPFPAGHSGWQALVRDSAEIMKRTGCHGIKLECSEEQMPQVARLVDAGIPVMAHLGLRPQQIQNMGKYSIQRERDRLLHHAGMAQGAGAFSILLECVEANIAREVSESLAIPVIGIGSGKYCDGQVLVLHDIIGLAGYVPKHAKRYADLATLIRQACDAYRADVENGDFPA